MDARYRRRSRSPRNAAPRNHYQQQRHQQQPRRQSTGIERETRLNYPQPSRPSRGSRFNRTGLRSSNNNNNIQHVEGRKSAAARKTAQYQSRLSRTPPISMSRYANLPRGELQARYRRHLLKLVNDERLKYDAQPVQLDNKLSSCARRHNADLAFKQQRLSHVGNDGAHLSQRLKKCGYDFRYASENVARGQKNPRHVVDSWMNSEGHKKNLLSRRVKKMGVHVGRGVDGRIYWSQLFANN